MLLLGLGMQFSERTGRVLHCQSSSRIFLTSALAACRPRLLLRGTTVELSTIAVFPSYAIGPGTTLSRCSRRSSDVLMYQRLLILLNRSSPRLYQRSSVIRAAVKLAGS